MYDLMGSVGILSTGATTNSNSDVDEVGDLPTTCDSKYLISVTNTNINDEKVVNAGYGSTHIDLGAPGRNTESIKPDNSYGKFGGTSASTPHVTGAIGLLATLPCENLVNFMQDEPDQAALVLREAILEGSDPLSTLEGITVSGGRLNLLRSMVELADFCSDDPSVSITGPVSIDKIDYIGSTIEVTYRVPDYDDITYSMYDMKGQLLLRDQNTPGIFSRSTLSIDMSDLVNGVYILSIQHGDELVSAKLSYFR